MSFQTDDSGIDERAAREALAFLAEPGDAWIGQAVAEVGAVEVLRRIRATGEATDRRLAGYQARLPALGAATGLNLTGRVGARLVVPGDDEWPDQLDDLAESAPLALWVCGAGHLGELGERAVALVGARACSSYGEYVAGDIAASLTDRRWTVVSGGAYGIDAAAHRGALAVGGATIVVLACGVDVAYPAAHHDLLDRVRERGAVISELPPGARPTKHRFLDRNRVIAALGRGTVVVEAAARSGALNTATHADALSRPVMAVPGRVTSTVSAGCHELIRTRGASLVTDAADVLDVVGELGADASQERRGETRPHDDLDPASLRVLDALPARRRATADNVARVAGMDAATVLRALADLAVSGHADKVDGRWRRAQALEDIEGSAGVGD